MLHLDVGRAGANQSLAFGGCCPGPSKVYEGLGGRRGESEWKGGEDFSVLNKPTLGTEFTWHGVVICRLQSGAIWSGSLPIHPSADEMPKRGAQQMM